MALLVATATAACGAGEPSSGSGAGPDTATRPIGDPVAATRPSPGDLFVVDATDATVTRSGDSSEITLAVEGAVLAFTDRPARAADRLDPAALVDRWASYGFAADPPNAALSGTTPEGDEVDVAVELTEPRWDAGTGQLAVRARPIGADSGRVLPTRLEGVTLFIDDASQAASVTIRNATGVDAEVGTASPAAVAVGFTPLNAVLIDPNSQGQISGQSLGLPAGLAVWLLAAGPSPGTASTYSYAVSMLGTDVAVVSLEFAADGSSVASYTPLVPRFAGGGTVGVAVPLPDQGPDDTGRAIYTVTIGE